MAVHADLLRLCHVLAERVGGHRQNRNFGLLAGQGANGLCRLVAVHFRHLNIHQHRAVRPGAGGGHFVHGLPTVHRRVDLESRAHQQHLRNLPVHVEIVRQEQPLPCESRPFVNHRRLLLRRFPRLLFGQLGRQPEPEADDEFRSLAGRRLHVNRAAHHIDDVLRDGHAEPRALYAADRRSPFPRKGLEHRRGKLFRHADAAVLHPKLERGFRLVGFRLLQRHGDRAALRREFVCVRQEIQEHAVQPVLIEIRIAVLNLCGVHGKRHALFFHLCGE